MLLEDFRAQVLLEPEIGTPRLDAQARPGVLSAERVTGLAATAASAHPRHLLALALLWHDHLEASHAVSQGLEDPSGAYLHGMMHRREGDVSNAKYWFHRAGPQAALAPLAARLALGEPDRFLLAGGRWNAEAFVDCCAGAAPASAARHQALQAQEFLALAGSFLSQQQ